MSDPTTLRAVSGLSASPARLRDAALMMIDLQNTYREGLMRLEGVEPTIDEARILLARARKAGIPIVHVRHDAGRGSPYDIEAPIGRISGEVAPQGDESVITKAFPSAFVETGLRERLERLGVKNLILTGFMTHMCINSTARSAFSHGFGPTVVVRRQDDILD